MTLKSEFCQPCPSLNPFLDHIQKQLPALTIHSAATVFFLPEYRTSLFDICGIHQPDSVLRSVPKRQAEYLAGRLCASQVLQKAGINQFDLKSGNHREPLWPDGIKGTISHNQHIALSIISTDKQVNGLGADLETILEEERSQKIGEQVLNPDEHHLTDLRDLSYAEIITLIFSVKESFFKAAFPLVQRYFGFEAVSVIHIEKQTVKLRLNDHLFPVTSNYPKGSEFCAWFDIVTPDRALDINTSVISFLPLV